MLLVKTKIGPSKIHGTGLIADQFIPKGTTVWKFKAGLDKKLPGQASEYVYLDQKTGEHILCGDNARFFNHSMTPNTLHFYKKEKYGQTVSVKDIKKGEEVTCDYRTFDANFIQRKLIPNSLDNPKVTIRWTNKYGRTLFAEEDIQKNEIITAFDGTVYEADKASDLPNNLPQLIRDHAIQFEKNKWRESLGVAQLVTHSCNPNCGIKDKVKIVAIRKIKKGEEISFDYDMSENSDWKMRCKCGNKSCRRLIRGYRYLPGSTRRRYKGYISQYLEKGL